MNDREKKKKLTHQVRLGGMKSELEESFSLYYYLPLGLEGGK